MTRELHPIENMALSMASGLVKRNEPVGPNIAFVLTETIGRLFANAELVELQQRVDRTMSYVDSLLQLPGTNNSVLTIALQAIRNSLGTAIKSDA